LVWKIPNQFAGIDPDEGSGLKKIIACARRKEALFIRKSIRFAGDCRAGFEKLIELFYFGINFVLILEK